MSAECQNFVQSIEPRFYADSGESVFYALFREYEHVIFRSILTAFALDQFIKDQYGGDVDTIYNVRKIGTDSKMSYKNSRNAMAYEQLGAYSHKDLETSGSNFQQIKHDAREHYFQDPKNNTVHDAYEDKPLGFLGKAKGHPTDKSAELDHVIAGKDIHDDRGRVLAGLSTEELADAEDNLRWTNEHLNKSMQDDTIPDYIAKHPELPEDTKARMMDAYNQAKASYEQKIAQAYYFDFSNPNCRKFYLDAASAAVKRGVQMGVRQAVGFLMVEAWFSVRNEIAQSDQSVEGVLQAIPRGLELCAHNLMSNFDSLAAQFGSGVLNGVLSSVTSTISNTFFTTTENFGKILRQAWASIVESLGVLFFNEKDQYLCDRMTSAAKILATGAGMIVGTTVQESVQVKLAGTAVPSDLKDTISIFAGSLCTGLLTITFLFYIDNDPFQKLLENAYGAHVKNLREQGQRFREYCAELEKIDIARLEYEGKCICSLVARLEKLDDPQAINTALWQTTRELGLPSPLGQYTLDERMNDKKWILKF